MFEADLCSAAASYLQQCSFGSASILPTTALLEMAMGCGMLMSDGSSGPMPAVLAAAVAAQLPLEAGQQQLVTSELDVSSGAAVLWHTTASMQQREQLLAYSFGIAGMAMAASAPAAGSQPTCTLWPVLLQLGSSTALSPAGSTASLASPEFDSSACHLHVSLCEAAGVVASNGAPTCVAGCAAFLAGAVVASPQQPQLLTAQPAEAHTASLALQVAVASDQGSLAVKMHGLLYAQLARARPEHKPVTTAWRRQAIGEAACRCGREPV